VLRYSALTITNYFIFLTGHIAMSADSKPRIFVVDDDPLVADAVTAVLLHAGFQVSTFTDPVLAAQQALHSEPNVVVTDYAMPHIDGLALAAWLQEHFPNCRIVILTGYKAALDAQAVVGLRYTLLQKPFTSRLLIDAVRGSGPPTQRPSTANQNS
jgi:FixJ family two-component response regulator